MQISSAILKQRPARAWLKQHADPADTVLYVGIDWSEANRTPAIVKGWAPWTVRFPMGEPPHLSKQDMIDAARAVGLTPPRLYELGFSHNNYYWTTANAQQLVSSFDHTRLSDVEMPAQAPRRSPQQERLPGRLLTRVPCADPPSDWRSGRPGSTGAMSVTAGSGRLRRFSRLAGLYRYARRRLLRPAASAEQLKFSPWNCANGAVEREVPY